MLCRLSVVLGLALQCASVSAWGYCNDNDLSCAMWANNKVCGPGPSPNPTASVDHSPNSNPAPTPTLTPAPTLTPTPPYPDP